MIGASILCGLVALAGALLAALAAHSRRWIHATTAAACTLLAVFAAIWFAGGPASLSVWPDTAPVWVLLAAVWLLAAMVLGLIFWARQEVQR
ncbi:hypothetical protein OG884_26700 [Streptosporangium sp. NBC_01755]|uniref:hypothetical protein n=1 Tax=Streptosporangium sp. NBC_01755 TaxID=2975949 RepID=UPI002DD8B8E8|nr:hypothetical protein [Streptosporangium sp. NBC_01755]WSC98440.1 hypothetical protein OG884_26700 [Streptosporangium sp. NBC_01755]